MIRVTDYLALVEASTYRGDRVRPAAVAFAPDNPCAGHLAILGRRRRHGGYPRRQHRPDRRPDGDVAIDRVGVADVTDLVTGLVEDGLARESIRKTRSTLAMVLDLAGVVANPARDKSVKLPRLELAGLTPPTAAHVEAVRAVLSGVNAMALVVLDATGMRISELDGLLWGDVDEPAGRWRVRREVAKTRRRWVPVVPVELFDVLMENVPREDRDLSAQVLDGFGADRFRTALGRACRNAGVPEFSPHDLRHRRATLWHLQGVPIADAASWLGHSSTEHLRTYAHASLSDRRELDYSLALGPAGLGLTRLPLIAARGAALAEPGGG
jgi:integrase